MDYIAEIRELAEKCHSLGVLKHHHTMGAGGRPFGTKATMKQIQELERDICLTLPVPLVRYLTELGNGGIGADHGIYSLDEIRRHNASAALSKDLPPMLDHSLTDEQWTGFAEKYTALDEKLDYVSDNEGKQIAEQLLEMERKMTAGGIFISTPGCTMNSILMCRGASRGEVFVLDFDYMDQVCSEPYCCGKFEDWIINDLRRKLKKAEQ